MRLDTTFKNLNKSFDRRLMVSVLCNKFDLKHITENSHFTIFQVRALQQQHNVYSVVFTLDMDDIHRIYSVKFKNLFKHQDDFKIRSVCSYDFYKRNYKK